MDDNLELTPISDELDMLSCDLMGDAFDALADGMDLPVLISYEDSSGNREIKVFSDDGFLACLEGAREYIKTLSDSTDKDKRPIRYALVYPASVANEEGIYEDAVILEYGEKGQKTGFSAYSLIDNIGEGESFMWSEPAAAGETDLLV